MAEPEWQKIAASVREGTRLQVKITPGAAKTKILGPHGDCLKIAVNAPPEKGKANHALVEMLSKILDVPKQQILVQSGHTSPRKVLLIQGITPDHVLAKIRSNA
jgi:uncharacterized protein (TIGR00251 family)